MGIGNDICREGIIKKVSKNMEKQIKLSLVPKGDPVKRKVCMNVIADDATSTSWIPYRLE